MLFQHYLINLKQTIPKNWNIFYFLSVHRDTKQLCITFQVNGSFIQHTDQEQPNSMQDLLSVLRKTARKTDALNILEAYVLGVNYPDELFCSYEADPQAPSNAFDRRLFHVFADANEDEVREIEQISGNEGWLKPFFDLGDQDGWFYGPMFCYEEKVINVSHKTASIDIFDYISSFRLQQLTSTVKEICLVPAIDTK